jgi:hypothetical protein
MSISKAYEAGKQIQQKFGSALPVCRAFLDAPLTNYVIVAASQLAGAPNATDVYLDSRNYPVTRANVVPIDLITPTTVLHEALHNLTGLDDSDLYHSLTGLQLNGRASSIINSVLLLSNCSPAR